MPESFVITEQFLWNVETMIAVRCQSLLKNLTVTGGKKANDP